MSKIKLIVGIFVFLILVGTITSGISLVSLSKEITFDKEIKDSLEDIGIGKFEIRNEKNILLGYSQPVISKCKVIDECECQSNIYQEKGINKNIKVITKYCQEYEIEFYDGECLNWINENCLEYEVFNRTTSECKVWKTLTDKEIEKELENKVKELLINIAEINIARNVQETEIEIGEEYKIEIK